MKITLESTLHVARKAFGATIFAGSLLLAASGARAQIYNVNLLFMDGANSATLTGTVDIPIGNYTIQSVSPSPFTAANLTLTVNATSYAVDNVLTDIIHGTGQFFIDATATTLTFNTANTDAGDPADLVFSDNLNAFANDRFVIGSNGDPQFEAAYTGAGSVTSSAVTFPTVFGNVVATPEPATLALAGLGAMALMFFRRQSK
jgi:hypothetical protein